MMVVPSNKNKEKEKAMMVVALLVTICLFQTLNTRDD